MAHLESYVKQRNLVRSEVTKYLIILFYIGIVKVIGHNPAIKIGERSQ